MLNPKLEYESMELTDKEALIAAKRLLHQICLLRHLMLRMCLVLILCSCLRLILYIYNISLYNITNTLAQWYRY
ncbi:hypothetical protein ACJIZ3_023360 [Penstemon smallii]|uniref:Uncharacterized protein n=1 Tax=Penstemon smallii TaxID=265156 RepID=A0ABD3TNW8_9LAMI